MFFKPKKQKIDRTKLPETIAEIFYNFLVPAHPNTDESCLLNLLLAKIAHAVSFNRVQFKLFPEAKPRIANYYALSFVPSGRGKDRPVDDINSYLLKGYEKKLKSSLEQRKEKIAEEARKEAEDLFKFKAKDRNKKIEEFVEKATSDIRDLTFEIGGGSTKQALSDDAIQLHKNGFGSLFLRESEFGLSIQSGDKTARDLYSKVMACYDGDFPVVSLKGEKKKYEVKDIPVNLLFYSSIEPILDEKNAGNYLKTLLSTGFIRRCCISFQKETEIDTDYDVKTRIEQIRTAYSWGEHYGELVTQKLETLGEKAVFICDDDVQLYYYEYNKQNEIKHNLILKNTVDEQKKKNLANEINARAYKVLKIACIIAAFEHPELKKITIPDMDYAIYISEVFSLDLDDFLSEAPKSIGEVLFDLIKSEPKGVTKMQIRNFCVRKGEVGQTNFRKWFDEIYPAIEETALSKGYVLPEPTKGAGSTLIYKVVENKHGKPLSEGVADLNEVLYG